MADKTIRYHDTKTQSAVDVLYRDGGNGFAPAMSVLPTPTSTTASPLTGQVTVTTAGTAVQGSSIASPNGFMIFMKPSNTSYGYIGNNGAGDVASNNGVVMDATKIPIIVAGVDNLNKLWFDVAVSGEGFSWMKL